MKVSNTHVNSVTKATEKSSLLTHLRSIHEGVRHPCDQCDFRATHKSKLLRHFKTKHFREGIRGLKVRIADESDLCFGSGG